MKVLFILAHPDDESYGPSGSILKCTENGAKVFLLTLTKGEAGTLGEGRLLESPQLADMRCRELECAAKALKIHDLIIGDFQDGKLNKTPSEKGVSFLQDKINTIKPEIIITFHPNGITGHPDHITISRWTLDAVQNTDFPVILFYYGITEKLARNLPDRKLVPMDKDEITHEIDVSDYVDKKVEAIHCHKSQLEIFEEMKNSAPDFPSLVRKEYFSQVIPKASISNLKYDLFE
jgi:LmbE family N-acetylglucosaminyl deacetylase